MRRFLFAFLLCVGVSNAYGAMGSLIDVIGNNLEKGATGMCYAVMQNRQYSVYSCGEWKSGCSGGGQCTPKCDNLITPSIPTKIPHGAGFKFKDKNYFCCIKDGNTMGVFVQKDSWATDEKKIKKLADGSRCYYTLTTDACGNITEGDCESVALCPSGQKFDDNNNCVIDPNYDTNRIEFLSNNSKAITYKSNNLNQIFECGRPSECTTRLRGNHAGFKEGSCKTDGEKFEFDNKTYKCDGGTYYDYGKFVKVSTEGVENHNCSENQFWNSEKEQCVDKDTTYTAISKTDMEKCFACRTNSDFKTCAINKCYQSDSDTSKCTPELKTSCLL